MWDIGLGEYRVHGVGHGVWGLGEDSLGCC